jgi:hypothetical protein
LKDRFLFSPDSPTKHIDSDLCCFLRIILLDKSKLMFSKQLGKKSDVATFRYLFIMIRLENAESKPHGVLEMSELHVAFSLIRMDLSDMQVIEICFPEDYPASPPTLAPSKRSSDWPAAAGIESNDSDEEARCVENRNRQQS